MGERYVFWMRLREDGIPDAACGVWALWGSCLESAYRTPLAGECPLFSAWGRFEDGAPASRVRYALWVAYPSGWLR